MPKFDPLAPLMMVEFYRLGCNVSWIAQLMDCSRDRVYRQIQILIGQLIEETGAFSSKEERELSRLHKIISDQEQVIRVLRNQVAKGTLQGMYEEQGTTPLNKGRNRK